MQAYPFAMFVCMASLTDHSTARQAHAREKILFIVDGVLLIVVIVVGL
jgi:hypothetical protein